MTLNLTESRIYNPPDPKPTKTKPKKNNKVTFSKQRHEHDKRS